MKIYLAAAWSRREEMKKLAADLEKKIPGLIVNSRWIKNEPLFALGSPLSKTAQFMMMRSQAVKDREDIYRSNALVRLTDDLSSETVPSSLATGSRMVEMGLALRMGIPVIVVGGMQCIFDWLPEVQHVKNIPALKRKLRQMTGLL